MFGPLFYFEVFKMIVCYQTHALSTLDNNVYIIMMCKKEEGKSQYRK